MSYWFPHEDFQDPVYRMNMPGEEEPEESAPVQIPRTVREYGKDKRRVIGAR